MAVEKVEWVVEKKVEVVEVVEVEAAEPWKEACVHLQELGVQKIQMEQN